MATQEEMTDEQLEQMREWIDLQVEQIRLGKKDNEQAIKLWLEHNKYGKVIAATSKATSQLTKGFVESATSLADSTGDFGALSGVVGGTIKSMSSLAGVVSNVFGEIPLIGGAIDAVTDASIAFTKFGLGELQKSFNSFQELSEAGQMGAGGIEEMAKRMQATNLPLATYSKLLKENSADLAFLSTSALEGGKSFSTTMATMANDTGMPLRRLGLSVAEIGDTVVDFQVMQRRQGLLGQLSQTEITKGTEAYAKELDLIAKLTGKSRKEVQKEREETMSDSRFRAAMMDRSQKEQQQHIDAIAQISDPTLKRAYMDQVSGFTNSTASITAEISGMGGSIRAAIAHIDDLGGTSTEAVNIMREQARAVTETGGVLQSYSKVVESGGGVMMNFAKLADFAVQTLQSQQEAAEAQKVQMASLGSAADEMANAMRDMQKGTSIMNALFTETKTASMVMGEFAKTQKDIMVYTKAVLNSKDPFQQIIDDAANKTIEVALDLNEEGGQFVIDGLHSGFVSVFEAWDPLNLYKDKEESKPSGSIPVGNGTEYSGPPAANPMSGPNNQKQTPEQIEYTNLLKTIKRRETDIAKQERDIAAWKKEANMNNDISQAEAQRTAEMVAVLHRLNNNMADLVATTKQAKTEANRNAKQ